MSTPEPLRSNGLPFVFGDFRLDTQLPADEAAVEQSLAAGGPIPTQPGFAASDQTNVMPLADDIVSFPTG